MTRLVFTSLASFIVSILSAYITDIMVHSRIAIVGSFIGFKKSYNDGIAFGIDLGTFQEVFIVAALCCIVYLAYTKAKSELEHVGFGLIIGGALGNIADRMLDGKVTDMIQVGGFPIFNVADALINIGIAVLLIDTIVSKQKKV